MALFPRIESPCPYKNQLSAVMEGDFCRMCKRHVVDLTEMSDERRLEFLRGCEAEVCVSYRLPVRAAVAAALAAASVAAPVAAAACEDAVPIEVVVGGLRRPAEAEMVRVTVDAAKAPQLPVVYEDA